MNPEGRLRGIRNRIEQLGRVAAITFALTPSSVRVEQSLFKEIPPSHTLILTQDHFTTGEFRLVRPDEGNDHPKEEEIITPTIDEKVEELFDPMNKIKQKLKYQIDYQKALEVSNRIGENLRREEMARAEAERITVQTEHEEEERIALENQESQRLVQSSLQSTPIQGASKPVFSSQSTDANLNSQDAQILSDGTKWDVLAQCESGGNPSISTGNGFYGLYQFTVSTWLAYGGGEFASRADLATAEQQTIVADRTAFNGYNNGSSYISPQGPEAWPVCSYRAGMR